MREKGRKVWLKCLFRKARGEEGKKEKELKGEENERKKCRHGDAHTRKAIKKVMGGGYTQKWI